MTSLKFNEDNYILELTRGDTALLEVKLVDGDNYPADVTDYEILLTVKEWTNDSDVNSKFQLQPYESEDAEPENGIIYFKFIPDNTKNLEYKRYSFDIQLSKNGDIYTPLVALLLIKKEVKF